MYANVGRLGVLASLIAIAVLMSWPSPHASADVARPGAGSQSSGCQLSKATAPTGTAQLAFTLPYIDEPGWTSTVTETVPTSWPYATDLLMNPASSAFKFAYSCLFATDPSASTSISLGDGDITVKTVTGGQIGSWSFRLSPPWNVPDSSDLSVSFAPDGAFSRVAWTKATVSAQGFTITNPRPLPTSDDADASVSWYKPALSASAPYSISIHPEKLLSTELTLESGPGEGQYAPYDFEEALFAIVLALLLSRRRRTKVEVRETVGSPTRLLCVVVAILATVQFWQDIQSQISELPYKVWGPSYALQQAIQVIVICAAAVINAWRQPRRVWRVLAVAAALLGVLTLANQVFQALLPFNTSVFTWIYGSGLGPELFQFATAGSLYFMCWLIPLTCVSGLLRSLTHSDRLSRMPIAVGAAAALTGCSLYLAIRTYGLARAYNFLNSLQVLRLMAGFVIVFGIIGIVAVRKRDVPILLESRDKALLAWATGYAMLVALPQSYLGIHLGFVALIAVPVTYAVLRICGSDAPAEQSREVLDGKKPEEIVGLQQSLANADGRLAELTEELKYLDTEPAGAWQAEQRLLLKREADRLRCWPEEEQPAPVEGPWLDRMLGWLFRPAPPPEPTAKPRVLPKKASPIDMALALGSDGAPAGILRMAFGLALLLAAIPACYFAWHDVSTGASFSQLVQNSSLPLLIVFSRELTFWLFPMLLLALAWSSLAGRRGPGRALQIWACIAVPVTIHVIITKAIGQSGTLNTVVRWGLLLLCLVVLGLALDLMLLRRYSASSTIFSRLRNYLRVNRLAATMTLVVPLVTALLSIAGPIESGGVNARISPSQGKAVTAQTQTQTPPSHPAKHS